MLRVELLAVCLASAVGVTGCTSRFGVIPVVALQAGAAKMIRPQATASSCEWVFGDGYEQRFAKALKSLASVDAEIDSLRNVTIAESRYGLWPLQWSCLEVTADAVRGVSTVAIPMMHEHHH